MVPLPEATLHVPVPTAGVLPNIGVVGELIHTTVFEVATAALGNGFIVKITLDADCEHTPFVIVHKNIF